MMKCSINEIFGPTIQGEGMLSGTPSIFVRFNGCNLRCCFKGGSICDTAYTSHNPEHPNYTDTQQAIDKVKAILKDYPNVQDIVFTGGEPMLQQEALVDITTSLHEEFGADMCFTVETNGTVPVIPELEGLINLWSISPKLKNSCYFEGHDIPYHAAMSHKVIRVNYGAVISMIEDAPTQLKFVYTDEETEKDICEWLDGLTKQHGDMGEFPPILIMPEGEVVEQINKSAGNAIKACIKHGWQYCDRVHIRIWGNKRAV